MRDIPNMTNDRLACRRGPAGGSLAASVPTLQRPVEESHSAQAFHHRNAFFVFGGVVESGR
jgi:hypothetical protein